MSRRDGVLLHVLAHVDARERLLVVEEEFGERLGELGLADAGGPDEEERAQGPVGVGEPGSVAADGVGHGLDRRAPGPRPASRGCASRSTYFCASEASILDTGMPVQVETTRAMSSSETSSRRSRALAAVGVRARAL